MAPPPAKKKKKRSNPVDAEADPPLPADDHTSKKKKKSKKTEKNEQSEIIEDTRLEEEENGKKNKRKRKRDGGGDVVTDPRFASVHSDPRFQRMPRRESKVVVDARFAALTDDPRFAASSTAPVDKRGKRRGKEVNPLLQYYLNEEEVERGKKEKVEMEEGLDEEEDEDERDLTGEEGGVEESSSSDDEDEDMDDEVSVNSDICRYLMASHEDTPITENETHRLAVVNMDWDHIKAVDIYVVVSSCLPKGGQILSVAIYPSEYGLKCMEVEAVRGPSALFDDDEEQSGDESEVDDEKVRSYELNKLRYYYAVVVCDSSATANHIYKTLDGTEFLRTSNVFDLRFIPDSMEFKHPPRDITKEAPISYKQPDFHTRALQHSKVNLSWEDDEPERKKTLRQKFNPEQLDELNAYLASSGESDDEKDTEKLRALLQSEDASGSDKGDDKDMEITFNTGLEDLSKRILEKKDKKSETVWETVLRKRREKKKARKNRSNYSSEDDSTDFDVEEAPDQPDDFFVDEPSAADTQVGNEGNKESAKKKGKSRRKGREQSSEVDNEQEASRAELELLFVDDQEGKDRGPKGYNLKPKKDKKKKGKEVLAMERLPDVDISNDPRFSSLLKNPLFALDPTDPQYKRSAVYARQRLGKQRVRAEGEAPEEETANEPDQEQSQPDSAPKISDREKLEFSYTIRSLKRNLGSMRKKP